MFINNLTKKRILVSIVASSILMLSGCGSNSSSGGSSSIQTASLVDSPISGIDYNTSTQEGITGDNGDFTYSKSDKYITFKIGNLKLGDFNLSKIKSDHKVLIGELFNLDRNNTTNANLIKTLRVLQSLDNDGNVTDGILINDNVKGFLDTAIENNASFNANLVDNNISTLRVLVAKTDHKLINERQARKNYAATLKKLGYTPTKMPFITVWGVNSTDKNITVPINPNYAGDYNYTVTWGDGNISKDVNDSITHTYSKDGNYTVKISGNFPAIYLNNDGKDFDWYDYVGNADKLIEVKKWGDTEWKSFKNAFEGDQNLKITATDTPNLKNVKDMSHMFAFVWTTIFDNDNIDYWDVSNVTDMNSMFATTDTVLSGSADYYHGYFNQNIKDWNTSNVTNMDQMFMGQINFNQPLNNWDVSNVTSMVGMFFNAKSFNQPLNNWDVSNVTNMEYMFCEVSSFNQPLNDWNVSNITNMEGMFWGDKAFNQPLNNWNVSNVTNMDVMLWGDKAFNQPLNDWNVSNVTDMGGMFWGDKAFNQPLNNWNVSNVTSMDAMFWGDKAFNQPLNDWNVSNVTYMGGMFAYTLFNQPLNNWNVSNVTDMSAMFDGAASFDQNISMWDVSKVQNTDSFAADGCPISGTDKMPHFK